MYIHETQKRVRYGETDKMGFLYYGNYALYFEIGRVEMLRSLGLTYQEMEDKHNVMMPVMKFTTKYIRPAYYDELLTIKTAVPDMPYKHINFMAEIFNEKGELINIGEIKLAFITADTKGRIDAPEFFLDLLKPYFNE